MSTITLPLGGDYGTMIASETFDYDTGNARYVITAPRVTGTFVIRPPHYGDDPIPTDLGVWYGDGHPRLSYIDRFDRPIINGVRLIGGTVFADPDDYADITCWGINADVATSRYTSRPAPDKTTQRAAAVIRALLGHYCHHPQRRAITRAAARHDASARLAEKRRVIARLREEATEINTQLNEHTRQAALLSRLAVEHTRHQTQQRRDGIEKSSETA